MTRGSAERNPSTAMLDFVTADRSARLVVWSDGQAQLNAGSTAKTEVLLDEYRADISEKGLDAALESVLSFL